MELLSNLPGGCLVEQGLGESFCTFAPVRRVADAIAAGGPNMVRPFGDHDVLHLNNHQASGARTYNRDQLRGLPRDHHTVWPAMAPKAISRHRSGRYVQRGDYNYRAGESRSLLLQQPDD